MRTRLAQTLVTMVLSATLAGSAYAGHVTGSESAGSKLATAKCMACHMMDGNSVAPMFPKIAGQIPAYMVKQLMTFKDGTRVSEQMSPQVKDLTEQDIQDLAVYFSKQQRKPSTGKAELMAEGEKLYKKGVFYTTVTACVGCHGMRGEGNENWHHVLSAPPAVLAPAVGSQHPEYLVAQLKAFRSGERANDVGAVMQKIAEKMTDEQIEAVSAYMAQLQ